MTAVADVAAGVVHAAIDIAAPPERVFEALTTPGQLATWWGSDELYRTSDWQVDLRVGGKWSCKARNAQGDMTVRGEYLEIRAPTLLVVTWEPGWEDFFRTTIRYELERTPSGTRLKLTHTGFQDRAQSAQGHAEGWTRVLNWLETFMRAGGPGA